MLAEAAADAVPLTPVVKGAGGAAGIWHYGGFCSPFDLSALFLVIAFFLISSFWGENYGSSESASKIEDSLCSSIDQPVKQITGDVRILMIGIVVSLFEGSMYVFVFNWTPALASSTGSTPFGLIFATFMVACMGGSSLFAVLSSKMKSESMLRGAFVVGSLSFVIPLATTNKAMVLGAFCAFEAVVGMYWPAMGTVKSQVVPEESRATIYNIFRVPLNGVVLAVLLNHMETVTAFGICAGMLAVAAVAQSVLFTKMAVPGGKEMSSFTVAEGKETLISRKVSDEDS
jgi:hypothetical protein